MINLDLVQEQKKRVKSIEEVLEGVKVVTAHDLVVSRLQASGWKKLMADGKLHPLLNWSLFREGQRVYPRTVEEIENWDEGKDFIAHPSKWRQGDDVHSNVA